MSTSFRTQVKISKRLNGAGIATFSLNFCALVAEFEQDKEYVLSELSLYAMIYDFKGLPSACFGWQHQY